MLAEHNPSAGDGGAGSVEGGDGAVGGGVIGVGTVATGAEVGTSAGAEFGDETRAPIL